MIVAGCNAAGEQDKEALFFLKIPLARKCRGGSPTECSVLPHIRVTSALAALEIEIHNDLCEPVAIKHRTVTGMLTRSVEGKKANREIGLFSLPI